MKITGFNEVTINGKKYDLSEKRREIIKNECNRIEDNPFCHVKDAVHKHLCSLEFKVIDGKLKLDKVIVDISHLKYREWWFHGIKLVGTSEEHKEQATEVLRRLDLVIDGRASLGGSSIEINGEMVSGIKDRLVNMEIQRLYG